MIAMRLLRPHTHAGKPRPVGEVLHVDAPTADWLTQYLIAEAAEQAPAPTRNRKPIAPHHADTDTTGDDHEH